jgi:serine/threonine protein kinase
MGVVYLARGRRLDRQVAPKALPEHVVNDPVRLARFEREA